MVLAERAPETGTVAGEAAGAELRIVVGVTHEQTCLVMGERLEALRLAGFRVWLTASGGELLQRTAERAGVAAVGVKMRRGMAPLADLLSLLRLWALLRRLRPAMTEFSTPKAGLLGTVAARLSGVPVRVYLLRGLKLETARGLKRRILLAAERLTAACATVVVCNSESLRAEALSLGVAPGGKLKVLGVGSSRGVDSLRFAPGPDAALREQLGLAGDALVLGFVGRITQDKGVPELIEAFETIAKQEPRTHLLLVGWFDKAEDAVDATVRARIEGNPRIHCTGFVEDTAPYYRAMDVMVLPTWREGFPNVVLEAQATGIPVITTISTGSRDSVVSEVTGLLIPPGYPEAVEEAALRLLGDRELRMRMGAAARAWVQERYSNTEVVGRAAAYYRGLLAGVGRPN